MGLLKPKGKHAQGAHAQETSQPDTAEDNTQEEKAAEAPGASAEQAGPSSAEAPGAPADRADSSGDEAASPAAAPVISPASLPSIVPAGGPQASDGAQAARAGAADGGGNAGEFSVDPFGTVTVDGVVLRKRHRVGKAVGITFGVIIGVLLIAYIAGAVVFMGRFFPNTSIVGNDVSMMSNDEVAALLDNAVETYTLDVAGNGLTYKTTAKDIDLSIDSQGVVDAMHADLPAWAWPALLFQEEHDESDQLTVSYKVANYDTQVTSAIEEFNKTAVAPVNATIAYDDQVKKFKVVDEVPGTMYDTRAVLAAMGDCIASLNPTLKLTGDQLVQPTVFSTDERLVNSAELATGLVSANITLTLNGQSAMEINGSNLSAFIHLDDNMGVTLDEAALDQWVNALSDGLDTVGSERTYTRADGKVITVSGGAYGWITDAPALKDQVVAAIKTGETTTIDIPCEQEAAVFTTAGQPDWGNRYVDVDISEQYVRFYGDDGNIIWEAPCISGSPDGSHDTWRGVWFVNNKENPSRLVGYENGVKIYETTVTYWMAFESSDIGFHDATWQPSFGGSMYASGYGSHGCVNLSYGDAESLYGIIEVGDCVVVHD